MPRNSSGAYSLPIAPFTAGTVIKSADMNSDLSDIGTALTQSVATTGASSMTGPLKLAAGTAAAPSLTLASDTTTGWYNNAAGSFTFVSATTPVMALGLALVAITGALTTTLGISVGGNLVVTGNGAFTGVLTANSTFRAIGESTFGNASTPIILATQGYAELVTLATVATGSASTLRIYVKADATEQRLTTRSSSGLESTLYPLATKSEVEAGTSSVLLITPENDKYGQGFAKVWACVSVSGGSASIIGSYNVAGVSRNSSGNYRINFTANMANTNYSVHITPRLDTQTQTNALLTQIYENGRSIDGVSIQCYRAANSASPSFTVIDEGFHIQVLGSLSA